MSNTSNRTGISTPLQTGEDSFEKKRAENARIQQLNNGQNGVYFMLFSLLFGLGDENDDAEDKNSLASQLSAAFGLNLDDIFNTSQQIKSGGLSLTEGAERLSSSVNYNNVDWSQANKINIAQLIRNDSPTALHPDLIDRMEKDSKVKQMVEWTFDAAKREGIDGTLLANQFWQESRFNPNAVSPAGAKGVAQFMPFHKGKWGLESGNDFFDPKASIDAGAKFMSHLTERTGSQQLALVAYNGGEKAIDYVEKNLSGNVSINEWMSFMDHERSTKGVGASNLWRNQTFDYVKKIDSTFWDPNLLAKAESKSTQLASTFVSAKASDQPLDTDKTQPNPLPFDGKGVDQVALAQQQAQNDDVYAVTKTPVLGMGANT